MRAELRLSWVRDLPVLGVDAGEGAMLMPMAGPWEARLHRCNRPQEAPGAADAPRVASVPKSPPRGAQEPG